MSCKNGDENIFSPVDGKTTRKSGATALRGTVDAESLPNGTAADPTVLELHLRIGRDPWDTTADRARAQRAQIFLDGITSPGLT